MPVTMAHVGITPTGSSHTWWVVTSVDGRFAMRLPAGTYQLTIQPPSGMGKPKDLPPTVTVTSGQLTSLDIHLDSGIR
jgi:Carboxypeptidase regulatory-like domain